MSVIAPEGAVFMVAFGIFAATTRSRSLSEMTESLVSVSPSYTNLMELNDWFSAAMYSLERVIWNASGMSSQLLSTMMALSIIGQGGKSSMMSVAIAGR